MDHATQTENDKPSNPQTWARRHRVDRLQKKIRRMDRRQDWILYLVIASLATGLMEVSPSVMQMAASLFGG
jgi:hypothetical protein